MFEERRAVTQRRMQTTHVLEVSAVIVESRDANPPPPPRAPSALCDRGMHLGSSHVASIVNTLVITFTGGALQLLVILGSEAEGGGTSLIRDFLPQETVFPETVRTVVGNIRVGGAVPSPLSPTTVPV